MRKMVKFTTAFLMIMSFHAAVCAQAFRATYQYDECGNRTRSDVVYLTTTLKSAKVDSSASNDEYKHVPTAEATTDATNDVYVFSVSDITFTVFPNPTTSTLKISLLGANEVVETSGNTVRLFDLGGKPLVSQPFVGDQTTVDMSSLPNGSYIISIIVNGRSKIIEVIKQ